MTTSPGESQDRPEPADEVPVAGPDEAAEATADDSVFGDAPPTGTGTEHLRDEERPGPGV